MGASVEEGGVSVPSGKAPRGPQVPLARRDAVFLPVKTFWKTQRAFSSQDGIWKSLAITASW